MVVLLLLLLELLLMRLVLRMRMTGRYTSATHALPRRLILLTSLLRQWWWATCNTHNKVDLRPMMRSTAVSAARRGTNRAAVAIFAGFASTSAVHHGYGLLARIGLVGELRRSVGRPGSRWRRVGLVGCLILPFAWRLAVVAFRKM